MKDYLILKRHCKSVFYCGSGNFWYEHGSLGDDTSPIYKMFQLILFSFYFFMTVLEIMAAIFGDLPKDEKSDSVTFSVSHTIVMMKIYSVVRNKQLIRDLNKRIVRICEEYEDSELMADKYKIIKINMIAYYTTVYGCTLFFVLEGLRKTFSGSHFVTVVTYYPPYEDDSLPAVIFRITTTLILCVMMLTMIYTVDLYTMVYLIIYKYKIMTLRNHIENLSVNFAKESETNVTLAINNLTNGLVKGIITHSELLNMCKDIDKAFGTVMALQLCQSSGSAVSLLLQIAVSRDVTIVAILKIIFFVVALFFLLALFLCNAGEITYQGSLLSDAIFYCGWHSCTMPGRIRNIVLISMIRAQRPLVMKAFKMVELTYATFLWVVRSTYSVFALFYTQSK